MTSIEQRKILGEEIKRRRIAKGIRTLREMSKLTSLSPQYLSQIESGYDHPTQKNETPSNAALEKIAQAIDLPLLRMQIMLGRFSDSSSSLSPEAAEIASVYDQLPSYAKKIVDDAVRTAKAVTEKVESEFGLASGNDELNRQAASL